MDSLAFSGNLSATYEEGTWVVTSYLVANAIILPMGAWFSMLLGRKRFYMICVGVFTVSSLLCGMAPTLGLLVVFVAAWIAARGEFLLSGFVLILGMPLDMLDAAQVRDVMLLAACYDQSTAENLFQRWRRLRRLLLRL